MADNPTTTPHTDDVAVDRFAWRMKQKMAEARAKGRGGWETCPEPYLLAMLRDHVDKGDMRGLMYHAPPQAVWSDGAKLPHRGGA